MIPLRLKYVFMSVLLLGGMAITAVAQNSAASIKKKSSAAWVGVVMRDVDDHLMKKEKLSTNEGAYIDQVIDDSPADSAGIQKHDVVVEFQGKKIKNAAALHKAVLKTIPGETVQCLILRNGKQQPVQIVIGNRKQVRHRTSSFTLPRHSLRMFVKQPLLGLKVMEMGEQLAEYFHAPNDEGVLVEEVKNGSPAAQAGFQAGDVIVRAGKRTVDNVEDIRHELRKHEEGDHIPFEVLRSGTAVNLEVEFEEEHRFSCCPQIQMNMFQSLSENSDGDEGEPTFDEIKPNLDEMRLNLERMKQDIQNDEIGTEVEMNILRSAPGASDVEIL